MKMDFSKLFTEKVLFDTATLLAVSSSILYGAGFFFAEGMIAGYGLSSEVLTLELWPTLLYGFVALLASPVISYEYCLVALIGMLPIAFKLMNKSVPNILIIGGFLFFILLQFGACFVAGERSAENDIEEFSQAYKTDTLGKLDYKPASLTIKGANKTKTVRGFSLEIPGNYFALVQQNKIIAIPKNLILHIEYQWPESYLAK